jgi:indolepyruvate ferredoxin oxidoreductase, beta subunit
VDAYPEGMAADIARLFPRVVRVELASIRRTVPMKVRNTALLGAASVFVPLGEEHFAAALQALSPRGTYDTNQAAFDAGRALAADQLREPADVE